MFFEGYPAFAGDSIRLLEIVAAQLIGLDGFMCPSRRSKYHGSRLHQSVVSVAASGMIGYRVIRQCTDRDFEAILAIINDGAEAYRSVIPPDRWKEPYMGADELRHEIASEVSFSGAVRDDALVGVMGVQPVADVMLIRHAYVRTARQNQGIGSELLRHLTGRVDRPVLIGTWAAARWAIRFYEGHAFKMVGQDDKDRLLKTYWSIPERQIETSIVLADARWRGAQASDEENSSLSGEV